MKIQINFLKLTSRQWRPEEVITKNKKKITKKIQNTHQQVGHVLSNKSKLQKSTKYSPAGRACPLPSRVSSDLTQPQPPSGHLGLPQVAKTNIRHGQKQRRKYKNKHKTWTRTIKENAKSKTLLLI